MQQISCSPFFEAIEGLDIPRRFVKPIFTNYDEKFDPPPLEHVSHYNQSMAINSKNEILIFKIFPSSLSSIAMRWFRKVRDKLTRVFGTRFVTYG